MDWSALASLLAVLVATLALWVTLRERTASHRQQIYQKQVEACMLLVPAVWRLQAVGDRLFTPKLMELKEEERESIVQAYKKALPGAYNIFHDHALFLPESVLVLYLAAFSALMEPDIQREILDDDILEAWRVAGRAMSEATTEWQKALGIGPRSREILDAIGGLEKKAPCASKGSSN